MQGAGLLPPCRSGIKAPDGGLQVAAEREDRDDAAVWWLGGEKVERKGRLRGSGSGVGSRWQRMRVRDP